MRSLHASRLHNNAWHGLAALSQCLQNLGAFRVGQMFSQQEEIACLRLDQTQNITPRVFSIAMRTSGSRSAISTRFLRCFMSALRTGADAAVRSSRVHGRLRFRAISLNHTRALFAHGGVRRLQYAWLH